MTRLSKSLSTLLTILLFVSFSMTASAVGGDAPKKWKRVKNKNNIQVFRAHTENSRLKTFKAVTTLELENIQSFVALMLDEDAYPEYVHMLSSAKVTTDGPDRFNTYLTTRMPWPVKDRHLSVDFVISQQDDHSIRLEIVPSEKMLADSKQLKKKGYILCPEAYGYYELKTVPDSKDVTITAEVFVDPGGYIPAFMLNLITADMSYFTTKKMRRHIVLDKYQNADVDNIKRRPWVLTSQAGHANL